MLKEPTNNLLPHSAGLTAEYHKARKQLMFWSAILFVWELIGVNLEEAKKAGGTFGAIFVSLKSPQAAPIALLILILYFAFKITIEWRQCSEARHKVREARLDFWSALVVAAVACLLYAVQALSGAQIANPSSEPSFSHGFFHGLFEGFLPASIFNIMAFAGFSLLRHRRFIVLVLLEATLFLLWVLSNVFSSYVDIRLLIGYFVFTAPVQLWLLFLSIRFGWRWGTQIRQTGSFELPDRPSNKSLDASRGSVFRKKLF